MPAYTDRDMLMRIRYEVILRLHRVPHKQKLASYLQHSVRADLQRAFSVCKQWLQLHTPHSFVRLTGQAAAGQAAMLLILKY